MKKRRIISILLTFIMAVGVLAGCGSGTSKNNGADNSSTNNNQTASSVTGTGESSSSSSNSSSNAAVTPSSTAKKTLVVYYSATGSTKAVAQTIAEEAGADLFEITPVKPYTSDDLNWSNNSSRVAKEHDDENLRNVELTKVKPDNWDSYDTVFVGYTIWWYIAAWPVNNFVKGNDFSGKTVIPFCTSASSGLGDSVNLLQKMAGTGTWQKGQRFSSGASASEVKKWVDSLNLNK